ncbi:hypothetical protein ES332_D12G118400v1 [Gossypium tomentosum]|uniref:Uncharacterized protein n=1 Tax=Gossypium tomentosum TaxID=34277 RepID=A0A5D2I869_GOSTO|nr:hypothetical protein ES332_D12G118400v1 [Gossypium tomentosum]
MNVGFLSLHVSHLRLCFSLFCALSELHWISCMDELINDHDQDAGRRTWFQACLNT